MNILLLRKEEDEYDKYHLLLNKENRIKNVTSIPVLDFEYNNFEKISDFVSKVEDYSGLIFTSRRAVTSFEKAATPDEIQIVGKTLDVYVVGRTTGNCASQLGLDSKGSDTGNAKELSELIIKEQLNAEKPLMFLCGNLARETIPKRLTENSIPNESISCYKTIPDEKFEKQLKHYLDEYDTPDVVVFFSPSGVEFHESALKKMLPELGNTIKIACIGSYTSEVVAKLGFEVASVAEKPTPESLFEAIKEIDDL